MLKALEDIRFGDVLWWKEGAYRVTNIDTSESATGRRTKIYGVRAQYTTSTIGSLMVDTSDGPYEAIVCDSLPPTVRTAWDEGRGEWVITVASAPEVDVTVSFVEEES